MARVLLAEDEALVRTMIYEDLTDHGHAVIEARTGDEAVAILKLDSDFDLILTDIRMPGSIDGWTLGATARDLIPGLRIIYATGYSDAMPSLLANERVLHKPFIYADVERLIADLYR